MPSPFLVRSWQQILGVRMTKRFGQEKELRCSFIVATPRQTLPVHMASLLPLQMPQNVTNMGPAVKLHILA